MKEIVLEEPEIMVVKEVTKQIVYQAVAQAEAHAGIQDMTVVSREEQGVTTRHVVMVDEVATKAPEVTPEEGDPLRMDESAGKESDAPLTEEQTVMKFDADKFDF